MIFQMCLKRWRCVWHGDSSALVSAPPFSKGEDRDPFKKPSAQSSKGHLRLALIEQGAPPRPLPRVPEHPLGPHSKAYLDRKISRGGQAEEVRSPNGEEVDRAPRAQHSK